VRARLKRGRRGVVSRGFCLASDPPETPDASVAPDAPVPLDASVPPDALADASACLPYPCATDRPWNPELCRCAAIDAGDALDAAPDAGTDAPPSVPPNRYRAIAIAVGRLPNCALLNDHRVKCWGNNGYGQLGLGDREDRGADPATMGDNLPTVDLGTGRTAKSLAAGRNSTCAILNDDTLKCWGAVVLDGDPDNGVLAFRRWNTAGNVLLTVVNLSDNQWSAPVYGAAAGSPGDSWSEIFNSQAPQYGGWNDSGNYLANLGVAGDGKMYIRLPKWSVLMFAKR
jgi:Alpha amylase, C-terminal all-beta domain/Regulator of chromosome condensation (RCC1) repeat